MATFLQHASRRISTISLRNRCHSEINYCNITVRSKAHTCTHQKRCYSTQMRKLWTQDGLSGGRTLLCRRQANVLVYASACDVRWNSSTTASPDIVLPQDATSSLTPDSIGYIPEPPPIPEPVEIVDALNALGEPTLASVGLGGWSPPGLLQTYMETLHVTCDLPWWAAIAVGTVAIRCLMFPLVIKAQRNAVQMNNHMPVIVRLQEKFTQARSGGNPVEAARAGQELMDYMKKHKVQPFKNFLVPMAQMPVFISVFIGLRRMASLPLESLKTGGLYWFTDLTVPDPTYLLPLMTMASFYVTLELGVDGVKASSMAHTMKWVMRIMPIFIFPFISNFPAAMLCYWLTSNTFSLVQVLFLKIPKVRAYFKIPVMKKPDPATAAKKKGFLEGFKETLSNAKAAQRMDDRHRVDSIRFKDAGTGPLQKTYKYDPTKMKAPRSKPGISAKPKL